MRRRCQPARQRSPLVIGLGEGENYVASDMGAVRPETDRVYIIEDGEMGVVRADGVELFKVDGTPTTMMAETVAKFTPEDAVEVDPGSKAVRRKLKCAR